MVRNPYGHGCDYSVKTGERPIRSDVTTDRLYHLALTDPNIEELVGRYHTRSDYLYGRRFYFGACPPEIVKRRIIETKQYIEDAKNAKKLAGFTKITPSSIAFNIHFILKSNLYT